MEGLSVSPKPRNTTGNVRQANFPETTKGLARKIPELVSRFWGKLFAKYQGFCRLIEGESVGTQNSSSTAASRAYPGYERDWGRAVR